MKNYPILFVLTVLPYFSHGQNAGNIMDQPHIQVAGLSDLEVTPDKIHLEVIINEKDNKGKESLDSQEKRMFDELLSLGLNINEQVTLKDLASNFKFYALKKRDIFTSRQYEIVVNKASTAAKVVVNLQNAGISNVELGEVTHTNMDSLKLEVKKMAVANAKEKATAFASTLGQSVGKAIQLREFENYRPYTMDQRRSGMSELVVMAESAPGTPEPEIEFEKIKLEARIEAVFLLE
jgi:hypothetical protein